MPITVVGSIAYDAVKTPFGERERMLGGAAVHFALAASFFEEVLVVGPVGEDFGESELEVMRRRGVDVSDIERVSGGKTFFWRGEYGWDLNSRETLDTQLGVFEGFQPKLSERSRSSDVLFLANIVPDLQIEVREQLPDARFVALDSMNLWIDIARERLVEAIEGVDCLILNDAELRQLTGKPNLVSAARQILAWGAWGNGVANRRDDPSADESSDSGGRPSPARGPSPTHKRTHAAGPTSANKPSPARGPSVIVAKQGEYGAALVTNESFFALPAYPLENVIDPTGAGDTFAGGFVGYIAAHPDEQLSDELLRRAMAHGTALASFNVEEFGTERIERLTGEEIHARVEELREITHFSGAPLKLRA
jgi:sugar/nucleoside kinase (ribokinase family)